MFCTWNYTFYDENFDHQLLAVVNGQALQKKATQTGTGAATDGVVDEETLETGAVVSELADAVEDQINNLFTDGVVTAGEVVAGILFTRDQLLGVEELTVGASADLVNDGGLYIDEDTAGNVFGLGEEGVERVITTINGLVEGHRTIRRETLIGLLFWQQNIANQFDNF